MSARVHKVSAIDWKVLCSDLYIMEHCSDRGGMATQSSLSAPMMVLEDRAIICVLI